MALEGPSDRSSGPIHDVRLGRAHDNPPYLLYLRSFKSEHLAQRAPDQAESVLTNLRNLLFKNIFGATEEQRLAKALAVVGAGISVGKPTEPPPEGGFTRLYIDNENWQPAVTRLMTNARLVVLRVEDSPGLLWELQTARQTLSPERLVILVPGDSDLISSPGEESQTFKVTSDFELPIVEAKAVHRTNIAAVIHFNTDWTPCAVPLSSDTYSLKHALESALDPILRRLDIHLRLRRIYRLPPPAFVYGTLVFAVLISIGAWLVHVSHDENLNSAPRLGTIDPPDLARVDEAIRQMKKLEQEQAAVAKAQKENRFAVSQLKPPSIPPTKMMSKRKLRRREKLR